MSNLSLWIAAVAILASSTFIFLILWVRSLLRLTQVQALLAALEKDKAESNSLNQSLDEKLAQAVLQVQHQSQGFVAEVAEKSWQQAFLPLKEKIAELNKTVNEAHSIETREVLSLKEQFKTMSEQTRTLTQALSGDSKAQGDWGELVIERILESSGLTEGREYSLQGIGVETRDLDGVKVKPDVIFHLPQGRTIILDSKVSLKHHLSAIDAQTPDQQTVATKRFIESIKTHIKGLASKDYAHLPELKTIDFVFLFVPTDAALVLALKEDPQIFHFALERNIGLVSPSLLIPNLRLIHYLWKKEQQSKNAEKIAQEAGQIYDKFYGLFADLTECEKALEKAQHAFSALRAKASSGPGNIVRRLTKLTELGAQPKKMMTQITEDDEPIAQVTSAID